MREILIRKDKDSVIGPQEFVVGYSKAPEQLQSSTRPICHSHVMMSMGREPATIHIAAYELAALRTAPQETMRPILVMTRQIWQNRLRRYRGYRERMYCKN